MAFQQTLSLVYELYQSTVSSRRSMLASRSAAQLNAGFSEQLLVLNQGDQAFIQNITSLIFISVDNPMQFKINGSNYIPLNDLFVLFNTTLQQVTLFNPNVTTVNCTVISA